MRPEKQIYTPADLQLMLSKRSGEHDEKMFQYGMALLFIVMAAVLTGWALLLWLVSTIIQYIILPVAVLILAWVAAKGLFTRLVEKAPGVGVGR